jgi:sulfate permease, SulP family
MCHGSSGLSAHVRLGARTAAMNVLLGGSLVILGVVFPSQVLELFSLLPVWALAGLLAYAGLRHALLVLSLSGGVLAMAVGAAAVGVVTGNLAITTGLALAAVWVPRMRRGSRRRVDVHP